MDSVDLPPECNTVTNNTTPSDDVEVEISPEEVVKENVDEEPMAGHAVPAFEDKCARAGFIQKILCLILLQAIAVLLIMVVFVCQRYTILFYIDYAHDVTIKLPVYRYTSLCGYLITLAVLMCCDKARTTNPYKIIMFVLYPVVYALFVIFLTLNSTFVEMFIAYAFYCIAIFILLMYSIFTFQTNWEFTTKTGITISAGVLLAVTIITALVSPPYTRNCVIFYHTLAMCVECAYAVWDMQQMMKPTYRYTITPTDFVQGVLLIRIDYIYYIVMYIKKSLPTCFEK